MEVRAKKSLGQHFLTDLSIARRIVDALDPRLCTGLDNPAVGVNPEGIQRSGTPLPTGGGIRREAMDGVPLNTLRGERRQPEDDNPRMKRRQPLPTLEIGPGMGVISQYLLERKDLDFKMIEIDHESVNYLLTHFPKAYGRILEGDFLKISLNALYGDKNFLIIGNFPYNISSQIFFKILDYKNQIPQVVCMIQKEVAERIAEKPGSKTYGILSVLLQAWYDIEYLFTVGSGAFAPPPKVQSAVIRLRRNSRTGLGCDETLFKTVVKTAFGQRRKTLRNSLKPMILAKVKKEGWDETATATFSSSPIFDLRPETLGVEDFVSLAKMLG